MTAGCTSGLSTAKPGFGLAVDMTSTALAARFANSPSWISVFIAVGIAAVHYDLSSYCTTDPPTLPTFVAQDFVDLIQITDFGAKFAAEQKLQQWLGAMLWTDFCQCTTGANLTPPTPPSPPANLPSYNPGSGSPPTGVTPTCADSGSFSASFSSGTTEWDSVNFVTQGFNPTFIRWQGGVTPTGVGPHNPVTITLRQTHGITPTIDWQAVYTTPPLIDVLVPYAAGAEVFRVVKTATATSTDLLASHISEYCTVLPPTGVSGAQCCPPDAGLRAEIDQILQLVTLIQRQVVPFGYVTSTVHTGLSGAGTLTVQGLIGAKVSITTDPTTLGVEGTTPAELFDRGFITWGTADGYPQSVRLEHNPQLSLPARCSAFTSLAYDLHPGVVATITELKREP